MPRLGPDEAALLKGVCRRPDDDTPRLVYADWLEERGRPDRAEFIRLQCQSAAEGFPGTPFLLAPARARDPRQERIDELWRVHDARWLRDFPKWAVAPDRPAFVRGFAERFRFVAAPFLRYGPQLLDRTPVRAVGLRQLRNVADELVRCVWLREVPAVDLSGEQLGDGWVATLAASDWLAGARHLDLSGNDLRDDAARVLAGCPRLAGLETLRLRWNRLTAQGVQALASSRFLGPAAVIDVRDNPVREQNPEAVRRILGRRGLG